MFYKYDSYTNYFEKFIYIYIYIYIYLIYDQYMIALTKVTKSSRSDFKLARLFSILFSVFEEHYSCLLKIFVEL